MNEYSPTEERLNIASHAFAALASFPACVLLFRKALEAPGVERTCALLVFGGALVFLYCASTLYHAAANESIRSFLKTTDHVAIYLLIAGTYTPVSLLIIRGRLGAALCVAAWCAACAGIVMKIFFTGRFKKISTALYILMGWMILPALKSLWNALRPEIFGLFLIGGLSYTLGALFYLLENVKFNHAIFHFLTILGSVCQFIAIFMAV